MSGIVSAILVDKDGNQAKITGDDLQVTLSGEALILGESTASIGRVVNEDSSGNELFNSTANAGVVKITNGTGDRIAVIDGSTYSLTAIDYVHHETHEGNHYFITEYTDIANGGTREYIFVTPNTTKWSHMIMKVENELEMEYTLVEGVATDADGTEVTSFNNDRNSANTAGLKVYHTPTNVTGGTTIASYRLGSARAYGGEDRDEQEKILKQNTKYHLVITNRATGATNLASVFLSWYEHTNKE